MLNPTAFSSPCESNSILTVPCWPAVNVLPTTRTARIPGVATFATPRNPKRSEYPAIPLLRGYEIIEVLDGWANATTGAREVAGLRRSSANDLCGLIPRGSLVKDSGLKRLPSFASLIVGYADASKIMLTSVIQTKTRRTNLLSDMLTPP